MLREGAGLGSIVRMMPGDGQIREEIPLAGGQRVDPFQRAVHRRWFVDAKTRFTKTTLSMRA